QRIEHALDRDELASNQERYAKLLTPMGKAIGEDSFGCLVVTTVDGNGQQEGPLQLPMRFEPDPSSCPFPASSRIKSFYLAQGNLKEFVTANSKDRYVWMANVANVPLDELEEKVRLLRKSVRDAVSQ